MLYVPLYNVILPVAQKKQALDNQVTEIRDILQRIQKEINPQAKLIENSQVHFIQTVASGILSIQNDYQKLNKTYEDLEYQLNQQGLKSQTVLPDLKLRALELSGKYMNFIERNKLLSDRDQNAFSRNIKENLLNFMTKYPDQDHIPIEKLEERLSEQRKINKIQRVMIGILGIFLCLSYFQVPSLEIYDLADTQINSKCVIDYIQNYINLEEFQSIKLREYIDQSLSENKTENLLEFYGDYEKVSFQNDPNNTEYLGARNISIQIVRDQDMNSLSIYIEKSRQDGDNQFLIDTQKNKIIASQDIETILQQSGQIKDAMFNIENLTNVSNEEREKLNQSLTQITLLRQDHQNQIVKLNEQHEALIKQIQSESSILTTPKVIYVDRIVYVDQPEISQDVQNITNNDHEGQVDSVVSLEKAQYLPFIAIQEEGLNIIEEQTLFEITHSYLIWALFGLSILIIVKTLAKSNTTDFLIIQGSVGVLQEIFFWIEILVIGGGMHNAYNTHKSISQEQYQVSYITSYIQNVLLVVLIGAKIFINILLK
eukprot:403340702